MRRSTKILNFIRWCVGNFGGIPEEQRIAFNQLAAHIPALIGVVALAVGVGYCAMNGSGHSGFDPRGGWKIFVPILLAAFVLWHFGRPMASALAAVVGVLGLGFGLYVHNLGIMKGYEVWISAGMPAKNPNSVELLIAYVGFATMALLGTVLFFRSFDVPREDGELPMSAR